MKQFTDFVRSELSELETRDVDTLFECLRDNLMEMGREMSDADDDELYAEIEHEIEAEKRADEHARGAK